MGYALFIALNAVLFIRPEEIWPELQGLRTLIRNARKEALEGKPPRAYRELFRVLKAIESSTAVQG